MAKKPHRISEADLLIPTLRKLAAQPNGRMTTSKLILELELLMEPTGEDAEILEGRKDTVSAKSSATWSLTKTRLGT
jgi:hypothetical protein